MAGLLSWLAATAACQLDHDAAARQLHKCTYTAEVDSLRVQAPGAALAASDDIAAPLAEWTAADPRAKQSSAEFMLCREQVLQGSLATLHDIAVPLGGWAGCDRLAGQLRGALAAVSPQHAAAAQVRAHRLHGVQCIAFPCRRLQGLGFRALRRSRQCCNGVTHRCMSQPLARTRRTIVAAHGRGDTASTRLLAGF